MTKELFTEKEKRCNNNRQLIQCMLPEGSARVIYVNDNGEPRVYETQDELVEMLVNLVTDDMFLFLGNRNNSSINFYILTHALEIDDLGLLKKLDIFSPYYREKREMLEERGYYKRWCNDGVKGLTYLI